MKSKEWENKNRELAAWGQSKSRNGIPFTVKRGEGAVWGSGVWTHFQTRLCGEELFIANFCYIFFFSFKWFVHIIIFLKSRRFALAGRAFCRSLV